MITSCSRNEYGNRIVTERILDNIVIRYFQMWKNFLKVLVAGSFLTPVVSYAQAPTLLQIQNGQPIVWGPQTQDFSKAGTITGLHVDISGQDASGANVTANSLTQSLTTWFQGAPSSWGTAAGVNTGTSGATIPLLNSSPTWSGNHTFNAAVTFNGLNTVGNGHSFNFADASGNNSGFVTSGNSLLFRGTTSAGAALTAFTLPLHTDTPILTFSIPISVGLTATTVLSGSSMTPNINLATNISGTFTGSGSLVNIAVNSDTSAVSATNFVFPLKVTSQFGGIGTAGDRVVGYFNLVSNVAIPTGGPDQQYNTLLSFYDGLVNVGGTGLTGGLSRGSAVAFYPQTWLHAGATNYSSAVNYEADIIVTSTIQQLTVGGTIAGGDVVSLVFTSASDIPGSPVTVTYTTGAGNTPTHIVNGLMAAINANANLQTAGIAGMQNAASSSVLDINSQTQTTISVAVSSTGAESVVLGSVISGASTKQKQGASITRGANDSQQGFVIDNGFGLATLAHAAISGGFRTGYFVQAGAMARSGTIFGAQEQTIMNQGSVQGPFAPLKVKYGFDLSNVNFTISGGASLRMPGFQVDGTGVMSLKNATFTTDTNGLTIGITGVVGSGNPAIVSGGGGGSGVLQLNYFPGDIVKDANGGQYLVATTNPSTGAATALTTLVQPSAVSSLGTAIATTGGSGTGLTITPTGVTNNTLFLQPSGGPLKGGSGMFTANGAVATTMTSLGPTGSHTTVQEWLTVTDASGTVRYIPAY